ncbi:hypothetical protein SASC598O11_001800 [Snodgrassella alvi SCGC AB-598-O11]|nr:hypothetical protein SASC598O11_001800 [Snodgrassella alvi SCGC AB-598-O11]
MGLKSLWQKIALLIVIYAMSPILVALNEKVIAVTCLLSIDGNIGLISMAMFKLK